MRKRKDKVLGEEISDPLDYPLHADEERTVFHKTSAGSEEEETECN